MPPSLGLCQQMSQRHDVTPRPIVRHAEIFSNTGQLIKRILFERPDIRQSVIINTLKPGTYLLRLTKSKDLTICRQSFTVK